MCAAFTRVLGTLACIAATAMAQAANLQVSVETAGGRPAPDVVVMVVPAGAAPAPVPAVVDIGQKDNRFEPYVSAVPVGSTVRFINRDRHDHHIRSLGSGPMGAVPPAKAFELRLGPVQSGAGAAASVLMDAAGSVTLGCHLHGSMRGHLIVAATPHVAVTDEFGRATLLGLPDGAAELRLLHPDQLTGQAPQTLQLSGNVTASARLSFNPPRRPTPRRGEYD
jgi:plastocyanin